MNRIIIFLVVLFAFVSCNKDKFNTKPTLKFKGTNKTSYTRGDRIQLSLEATDKEGDLSDSLFIFKINRNCQGIPSTSRDTLRLFYKMPAFPTNTNLTIPIEVNFGYQVQPDNLAISSFCSNRNDSCRFRFVIKDKAKNVSDTVDSPELVLIR
jgi:hypothetical protein